MNFERETGISQEEKRIKETMFSSLLIFSPDTEQWVVEKA